MGDQGVERFPGGELPGPGQRHHISVALRLDQFQMGSGDIGASAVTTSSRHQPEQHLAEEHVYRDDGYSGGRLNRPSLDRLRDRAGMAVFDWVLRTAPDCLARNYVHQVLLIGELTQRGCEIEWLDRPMSQDPHDQLLLQIRGAAAEYERTLNAYRMRRGRQAELRSGQGLPSSVPPYGPVMDPERPRDPRRLRLDPVKPR